MDAGKSSLSAAINQWYRSRLSVIIESILTGVLVGFMVVLFRFLLSRAEQVRRLVYNALSDRHPGWTLLWVAGLVVIGLFLGWAIKVRPLIKGSGIPQVKGVLLHRLNFRWISELPLKIITGVLSIGSGLSLGREGPSIQIGAYVGKGVLSFTGRPASERRFLITSASAAGVAAAFNAPLAGVIFALEELQKSFSPLLLACTMGASMAADMVASGFFGLGPVFDFHSIAVLPLPLFPWIALLGVLCGLLGDVFKRCLYLSQDFYAKLKIPVILRPVIPLLVSVPLGFWLYEITGGGHDLIESLSHGASPLGFLLFLLAAKTLFTALCYGSGTAGGIFLPLLACGALAGRAFGDLLALAEFTIPEQSLNFLILGMAGFFSGVIKAPVTGAILILEMSGNFNHLGGLVLVCLSAFVTADLIHSRPVYDVLLERILRGNKD